MSAEIVPLKLSPDMALREVRKLAESSENVVIVAHLLKWMDEHDITRRQVELCLQKGRVASAPFLNVNHNWELQIFRRCAGEELTCTVVIEWSRRLILVTVTTGI